MCQQRVNGRDFVSSGQALAGREDVDTSAAISSFDGRECVSSESMDVNSAAVARPWQDVTVAVSIIAKQNSTSVGVVTHTLSVLTSVFFLQFQT